MSDQANLGYREASTKRESRVRLVLVLPFLVSRVRLVLRAPLSRVLCSAPLKYNTHSAGRIKTSLFSFRYQRYYVKLFNVIFTYGHVGNNHHVCLLVLKLANVDLSCCKSDTIITLVISCTSLFKELRYGLHISVKVTRFFKSKAYNQHNI